MFMVEKVCCSGAGAFCIILSLHLHHVAQILGYLPVYNVNDNGTASSKYSSSSGAMPNTMR